MAKIWKKALILGAVAGAAWYFLKKRSPRAEEEGDYEDVQEDGDDSSRNYVTLDRQALKDKAGDVIDKVAPIIDDTRNKISPIISAAKEKVSSILNGQDKDSAEDDTAQDDVSEAAEVLDQAAEEASRETEEFFDDET